MFVCAWGGGGGVSPAGLGDNHLGPVLVESLPEVGVLQGHPDAALLEVSVRPRRHGDRGGPAEVALHVWRQKTTGESPESSLVWPPAGTGAAVGPVNVTVKQGEATSRFQSRTFMKRVS